jgi:hypothetical protein
VSSRPDCFPRLAPRRECRRAFPLQGMGVAIPRSCSNNAARRSTV